MRILVVGALCVALVHMPIELLLTIGRRWLAVSILVAGFVANAVANLVAIVVLDGGIRGAALATAGVYALLFVVATAASLWGRGALAHTATTTLAVAWTAGAFFVVGRIVPSGGRLWGDVATAAGAYAVALVLVAPLLILSERRYRLAKRVGSVARRLLRRLRASRTSVG
jgi:phage tail sheath gpL-like